MKTKNILFLTNSMGFGGAEKMIAFVANSLSDRGHSCVMINMNEAPNYVNNHRQKLKENIKLYDLDFSNAKILHKIKSIKEIAIKEKSDIIVAFTFLPNFIAKIVALQLRIPSIMSERGDPNKTIPNTLKSKFGLFFINHSKGAVFQTEGSSLFYSKGLKKRGRIIPNPIFTSNEIPMIESSEREKTIVSVGRLDNSQKRYDVMLESFRLFSQVHPDYILKLYGTGTDEEQIKTWAKEKGIIEKIKFMGLTKQPMQDISRDGIFLITSDFEGISNALLEAMAVGLPCVSTDHTPGGARLLIQHGHNGLLAPIGDAKRISECMSIFVQNPALAQKCGREARKVTERFSPNRIAEMWDNYICELCK